jgi:hypothetical protein
MARTVRVDADYPLRTVIGVLERQFLLIESPVLGAASTEGLRRDSVRLIFVAAEDGSATPFGTFSGQEILVRIKASANSVSVSKSDMPFSYGTRHAVTNGRVVSGETERYELVFRSPRGRVRRILRAGREGYAIDGSLRHEYSRAAAEELGDLALVARLEGNLAKMPLHDRGPAFTGLVAGGAPGHPTELWVSLPSTPRDTLVTWVRHDDSGEIAESVTLPAGFKLLDLTPQLFLGVRQDELGVERIVAYRR